MHSAQELDLIHALTMSSASLSALSCILLIAAIALLSYRKEQIRKKLLVNSPNKQPLHLISRTPVLSLAVSDLGASIAMMLSVQMTGPWCQAQAFLIQYFYVASFFWTTCFSLSLYMRARDRKVSRVMHAFFQAFSWGVPLIFAVVVRLVDAYGWADTWCWIDETKDTYSIYRMLFFYLPLWGCIAFNVSITIFTYRACEGTAEKGVIRKLTAFPAIFVLCFFCGSILRVSEMLGYRLNFLDFPHSFFAPLQGFLDAVVYGYTVIKGNVVLLPPTAEDLVKKSQRLASMRGTASVREDELKIPTMPPSPVATVTPPRDKKKILVLTVFIGVVVLRGSIQLILSFGDAVSPPFSLMWMRSLPAIFILSGLCYLKARRDKKFAELVKKAMARPKIYHVYLAGALNMVFPFLFFSFGEIAVPVGVASIMTTTQPMMVVVLQQFFSAKKLVFTVKGVSGLIVGFCGAVLICAMSLLEEDHKSNDSYYFYGIYIFGVILQSFGAVYWNERKTVPDGDKKVPIPWLFILTVQAYVGLTLCLLPSLLWEYEWPISPFPTHFRFVEGFVRWPGILVYLWLLFISGMVAFGGFYWLLAEMGPRATMVTYGFPLVGMIEGIIFKAEWAGYPWWACFTQVVGGCFVVLGLVLAEDIKEGKKSLAEPPKPEQQHLLADTDARDGTDQEEPEAGAPDADDIDTSDMDPSEEE